MPQIRRALSALAVGALLWTLGASGTAHAQACDPCDVARIDALVTQDGPTGAGATIYRVGDIVTGAYTECAGATPVSVSFNFYQFSDDVSGNQANVVAAADGDADGVWLAASANLAAGALDRGTSHLVATVCTAEPCAANSCTISEATDRAVDNQLPDLSLGAWVLQGDNLSAATVGGRRVVIADSHLSAQYTRAAASPASADVSTVSLNLSTLYDMGANPTRDLVRAGDVFSLTFPPASTLGTRTLDSDTHQLAVTFVDDAGNSVTGQTGAAAGGTFAVDLWAPWVTHDLLGGTHQQELSVMVRQPGSLQWVQAVGQTLRIGTRLRVTYDASDYIDAIGGSDLSSVRVDLNYTHEGVYRGWYLGDNNFALDGGAANCDQAAGDGIYSFCIDLPAAGAGTVVEAADRLIRVRIMDDAGNYAVDPGFPGISWILRDTSAGLLQNYVVDNQATAVSIGGDRSVNEGESVAFVATLTAADGGETFDWDYGDGSAHGNVQSPNHTYAEPGVFTVTCTVTDPAGNPATASALVTVQNLAPAAAADSYSVAEDALLTADAASGVLANDADPGGGAIVAELVSGPSHGVLNLAADGSFTYDSAANYAGADSFQYRARDAQGLTTTATVSLTVTAVNDPPTLAVPGAQSVNEDTNLVLAGVVVADVDIAASPLRTELSCLHGTLTLSGAAGLVFADGTANGQARLVFTGTLAASNAALDGLVYRGVANYAGADTVSLSVSDQGATGAGGAGTASRSVAVTVNAVNDPPILTVPAGQTVAEDAALTLPGISVADPDSAAASLQVVLSVAHGTLTLATTAGLAFTAGGNGQASMTFTGPLAAINAALTDPVYRGVANYNGADLLALQVNDQGATGSGGPLADSDSVAITVTAVNDAPSISLPAPLVVNEGLTVTTQAISVADPDAGGADLDTTFTATHGTLTLLSVANLQFRDGTLNGTALLTVRANLAELNAALGVGIRFSPDALYNGPASIAVSSDDRGSSGAGGAQVGTGTLAVTVQAVNDPPVLGLPAGQTVAEDGTVTFPAITVSDPDVGAADLEVQLSCEHGELSLASVANIAFRGGSNDSASMTFRGSLAAISAALDGIVYSPAPNYAGADSVSVSVDDLGNTGVGGALSDTGAVAVTVTPVNDPPSLSLPGAQAVAEDGLLSIVGIAAADLDAAAGTLEVQLSCTHGTLTLASTEGLAFPAGGDGQASMTLRGTLAAINTALSPLAYRPVANFNGADSLAVTLDDLGNTGAGGAGSDTGSVPLSVTAVNDAPVWALPGAQTVAEDQPLAIAGIAVSDVDLGAASLRVSVSCLHGTLTLAGTAGITFVDGADGTASMIFTGGAADVGAALDGLSYRGAENYTGADTLSFSADDQGATGAGGARSAAGTVGVTVTAVNDAPTLALPGPQSGTEDTDLVVAGVSVADVDAAAGDVEVALSCSHGVVTLATTNGLAISAGANGSASVTFRGGLAQVNAALNNFRYRGALNYNGADSLAFSVSDLGNTGAGGARTVAAALAVTLAAVNDAPVLTVPGARSVAEDADLAVAGVSVADPDASDLQLSLSCSHGALTLGQTTGLVFTAGGDGAASMTFRGTLANVNAAIAGLSYRGSANYNGADSIVLLANDQGQTGAGGSLTHQATVAVTVTPVNDAPVISGVAPPAGAVPEGSPATLTVTFSDVDAGDSHRLVVVWGDGNTQTYDPATSPQVISHAYANDGSYTAQLTLRDAAAATDTDSVALTISNVLPIVQTVGDQAVVENTRWRPFVVATFTDPGSVDDHDPGANPTTDVSITPLPNGATASTSIDVVEPAGGNPGTVSVRDYRWRNNGRFRLDVRVCDDDGCSSASFVVTVTNSPPVASASADQAVDENHEFANFQVATFTDAGADDLHFNPAAPDPNGTAVDWGDGAGFSTAGLVVTEPNVDIPGTIVGTHRYLQNGVYTVLVRVCDPDSCATDSLTVTVSNVAPALTAALAQATTENGQLTNLTLATFTDPGTLDDHFSDAAGPGTPVFAPGTAVDWGDSGGVFSTDTLTLTEPAGAAPGSLVGTHRYLQDGAYTVRVRICDDAVCSTASFGVTISNVAPTVNVAAAQTVDENHLFDGLELATFTDPGTLDDHFTDAAGPGTAVFAPGTAVDWGDAGSYVTQGLSLTEPAGGQPGRLVGTHRYLQDGSYTVSVRICDDDVCVVRTFTVTVRNVAPVVTPAAAQTVAENFQFESFQLASYTDPGSSDSHWPGGGLGTAVDWGDAGGFTTQGLVVSDPAGASPGLVRGTHRYLQDGSYTVQVRVCDDDQCVTQSFGVTVTNVAPAVTVAANQNVEEYHQFSGFQLATFTDPGSLDSHWPGGAQGTQVDWGDGNGFSAAELVLVEPDGATPGRLTGTHRYLQDGAYPVQVRICDDDQCVTRSFTVTVTNRAPELSVSLDREGEREATAVREADQDYLVLGTFTDRGTLDRHAAEVDWGDPNDAVPGFEPAVVAEPVLGAPPDPDNPVSLGEVRAVHTYCADGSYTVRVRLWDEHQDQRVEETFVVRVVNVAPVVDAVRMIFGAGPTQSISEGSTVQFQIDAHDQGCDDADTLRYRWVFADATPNSAQEDPTHRFDDNCLANTHQASCVYRVEVTVYDSDDATDTEVLPITVLNVPPSLAAPARVAGTTEGGVVTFRTSATDPSQRDMGELVFCWDFDTALDSGGDGDPANDCERTTSGVAIVDGRVASEVAWTYPDDHHGRHRDLGLQPDDLYNVRAWVDDQDTGRATDSSLRIRVENVAPGAEAGGYSTLVQWDPEHRVDANDPNLPQILPGGHQEVAEGYVLGDRCIQTTVEMLAAGTDVAPDDLAAGFYYRWDFGDGVVEPDLPADDRFCFVADRWQLSSDAACAGQPFYYYTSNEAGLLPNAPWVARAESHVYLDDLAEDEAGELILDLGGQPEVFSPYQATLEVRDKDGGSSSDAVAISVRNVAPHAIPGIRILGQGQLIRGRYALRDDPQQACVQGEADCVLTFTVPLSTDVQFSGEDSCDPGAVDDQHLGFHWFFADVQQSRDALTWTRTFETQGVKPGYLDVSDPQGEVTRVEFQVDATHRCEDASARIDASIVLPGAAPAEGALATVRGEARTGTARDLTFFWRMGDGSEQRCACRTEFVADNEYRCGCDVSQRYADDAAYVLQLTARDDQGCTGIAFDTLTVRNVAPVLRNGEPHLVTDPVVEARPFELAVAFDDPGADSHVIEWDCNADGFFERRGALGTCVLYTDAQPHEVWVRVTDDDAGVVTGSVSVPVQNGPPTAFTEALVENVFEGTQVQLFGSGSDAGRDPGDAQFAFEWTWDSPDLLPSSVQNPFYVFPNEGDYVGRLRVTDNAGAGLTSEPAPLRVRVANLPPVVLACHERPNDPIVDPAAQDPAAPPAACRRAGISAQELTDVTFVALASDPGPADRPGLRFSWNFGDGVILPLAPAAQAQRVVHQFPNQRVYQVQVTVQDPAGATATDTLSVVVQERPPVCDFVRVSADPVECGSTVVDVEASIEGGGTLTYLYNWGDSSRNDRGPNLVQATHAYLQDGNYTLSVRVSDPDGVGVDCEPVTVVVRNLEPRVSLGQDLEVDEGSSLNLSASAVDCSRDLGLGLTYSWDFGDGSEPQRALGLSSVDHAFPEPGDYTVTVFVEDDHPLGPGVSPAPDAPNLDQVVVHVRNAAPVFDELPPRQGDEGQLMDFTACVRDPGGLPAGTIEFQWAWGDGSPATATAGEPDPAACPGGQIARTQHAFPDNQIIPYQVVVTATDPQGALTAGTFVVAIRNVAPRILEPPDGLWTPGNPAQAIQGVLFRYAFEAEDPGANDNLHWELLVGPAGLMLDELSGHLTWTAAEDQAGGQFQVGLRVRDRDGASDQFFGVVAVVVGDPDQDGLPSWYEEQFDCLTEGVDDRFGDPDQDGLTSVEEYERDESGENSSPCLSNAPQAPAHVEPLDGAEVRSAALELVVEPAADADRGGLYDMHQDLPLLRYLFVVGKHLATPELRQVVASNAPLRGDEQLDPFSLEAISNCAELTAEEGGGLAVHYTVPAAALRAYEMSNDQDLQWMARACDGWAFGAWSQPTSFFYNPVPEAPAAPTALQPEDGVENLGTTPVFELQPPDPEDPDHDDVVYRFVIWRATDDPSRPVVFPPPETAQRSERGTVTFRPERTPLADDSHYCWHGLAVDDEGLTSAPTETRCFLVNSSNRAPSSPELKRPRMPGQPPVGVDRVPGENVREVTQTDGLELVFGPALDPDGNRLLYRVHWLAQNDLAAPGPDFSAAESSELLELVGEEGLLVLDGLSDDTFYYWMVVAHEADDLESRTEEPEVALFFVNSGNDLPDAPVPEEVLDPTVQPTLRAACAFDSDYDRLLHACELRVGDAEGALVTNVDTLVGAPRGPDCALTWRIPEGLLNNNEQYCFRCRACDQPGGCDEEQWGEWSVCRAFTPAGNICPSAPSGLPSPEARSHHPYETPPVLAVANVVDLDAHNLHRYVFELYDTDDIEGAEGPLLSFEVEEEAGDTTSLALSEVDISQLEPAAGASLSVYWRVKVIDPREERAGKCDQYSALGLFFLDGPPAPPEEAAEGCCGHMASVEPPRAQGRLALFALVLVGLLLRRRRD